MAHARKLILLACCIILVQQTGSSAFANINLKNVFSLEELIPLRPDLYPERFSVNWVSDSEFLYLEPGYGIMKYDALAGSPVPYLDRTTMINFGERSVGGWSRDGMFLLLSASRQRVYRYSSTAIYSVYNVQNRTIQNIGEGELQTVVWGPGHSVAYVQNNNVYYINDVQVPEKVTVLTTEGVPDKVYFGVPDWIYEEEILNSDNAMWFSTKGTYLAVAYFNDTNVESASYQHYGNPSDLNYQYPETVEFKYPKAGRRNPIVGLRVYKVNGTTSEIKSVPAPEKIIGEDHILGRVDWSSDNTLVVLWLNRRQNNGVLMICDIENDKCTLNRNQVEPHGWIDIHYPYFDSTGTKMVDIIPLPNGDKRYMHASLFDFKTNITTDLSPVDATVKSIVGWYEKDDIVFYTAIPEKTPWRKELWAASKGEITCVSCKIDACQTVHTQFSPDGAYSVLTCSAFNTPASYYVYDVKKDTIMLIKDNQRLKARLSHYKLPMVLYNRIDIGPNLKANIKLILPPDMNYNEKYPMVVRVYAGPGSSRVKDDFELDYATYLASNRSFIVAGIDVRGSEALGVDAMFAVNNALGTYEVADTLDVIRKLASLYLFIDPSRIGVWGWSYGGFASTMMLIRDKENLLACAAAVAPVTSWIYYDSIYTERYMDTPQNNPVGYKTSDVTAVAEQLRGRKYLLVHGSGDDNVHYQNSMLLAKKLQQLDIDFEEMSYTDENHSLIGVSRHFYHTLDHFWNKCFNNYAGAVPVPIPIGLVAI